VNYHLQILMSKRTTRLIKLKKYSVLPSSMSGVRNFHLALYKNSGIAFHTSY
jgi:hypothetical protein